MELLVFNPCRTNLGIVFPSIVTTMSNSLTNNHPRIVVTEDTGILFVTSGIRANLTHLYIVLSESGIVEHHTMLAIQVALTCIQCLVNHTFFLSDSCHCAEAL